MKTVDITGFFKKFCIATRTIPAGETTWGAVFIANGLQLIIAVLLIVLGATIVVNSMRSYVASKHNSEAKV